MSRKKLKDIELHWESIVASYAQGISLTALSVHYDCGEGLIRKILILHGVEIRPPKARKSGSPVEATPAPAPAPEPEPLLQAAQSSPQPTEPEPPQITREVKLLPNDLRPPGWRLR